MAATAVYPDVPSESVPCSKVELSISCSNLPNMDILSKSDPICVLYTKPNKREWSRYGMTEMIKDNLNPKVCTCRTCRTSRLCFVAGAVCCKRWYVMYSCARCCCACKAVGVVNPTGYSYVRSSFQLHSLA